jgi:hypothetical protein
LAAVAVLLLAYDTVLAMVFAGETRYRVPFDFLIALCAAAAIVRIPALVRTRRNLRPRSRNVGTSAVTDR